MKRLLHDLAHLFRLNGVRADHRTHEGHLYIARVCATCGEVRTYEHAMACPCFELGSLTQAKDPR
jgi:hypothetical protein